MNKSFTLIEILVVIVVIGVLSAFILVGMSSITAKANIAKSQAFLNSVDSSLLLARVSQWKFDELSSPFSGGTVKDIWSTNDGTYYPGAGDTNDKLKTDCVSGKCLFFDGNNDYISNIALSPSISGDLTVSFWAKISSTSEPALNARFVDLAQAATYGLNVKYNNSTHKVSIDNSGGVSTDIISLNILNDNLWHHFIATRLSTTYTFYVDTISQGTSGGTAPTYTRIFIGGFSPLTNYCLATIDDVRIYNQSIPTSEIQQNYFLGLNKLFKNNGITLNEFNTRLVGLKFNLSSR